MKPRLFPDENLLNISVLDSFDQSLSEAGLLLVGSDQGLELVSARGPTLTLAGVRDVGFVGELPDGPLKNALSVVSPFRRLLEIGACEMQNASLALQDNKGKTRASANLRLLASAKGRGLVVSLQGGQGCGKALSQLRKSVIAGGGVPLAQADIYGQLFPQRSPYTAKPTVSVGEAESARDLATHLIRAYIRVARANEAGIVADLDTEYLHDYRIALRKIRSVLSLFKGVYDQKRAQALKERFSALMDRTGRLRDLDVFLLGKEQLFDVLPPMFHHGLNELIALLTKEREAEWKRLTKHLKSRSYLNEIEALEGLFSRPSKLGRGPNADLPALEFASAEIWNRYRKIAKFGSTTAPDTDDREIHKLRIQCKKLRYLLEFFAPVFPKKRIKSVVKPLKKLQGNLGDFNDCSVQQESLHAFAKNLKGPAKLEIAQCVGALIITLRARQSEERIQVIDEFARFNSPRTERTFRGLFHGGQNVG
ncbi:hypothetical protein AVO45_00335 [Ruegeria marisrubri]|uniref:CHAD domain-containing protein n=1 Tax=Ruegeria marisrubri TaxID=1685379 RepID=A0A0X3UCL2_9RHOB|nr:hypothetical protein AVO45_00335 [Ruegeria marisrubri]